MTYTTSELISGLFRTVLCIMHISQIWHTLFAMLSGFLSSLNVYQWTIGPVLRSESSSIIFCDICIGPNSNDCFSVKLSNAACRSY